MVVKINFKMHHTKAEFRNSPTVGATNPSLCRRKSDVCGHQQVALNPNVDKFGQTVRKERRTTIREMVLCPQ
jgi:hypothetical protein